MTDTELISILNSELNRIKRTTGNSNIHLYISLKNGSVIDCPLEDNNTFFISPQKTSNSIAGVITFAGRNLNNVTSSEIQYVNSQYEQTIKQPTSRYNIIVDNIESIEWKYDYVSTNVVQIPTPDQETETTEE